MPKLSVWQWFRATLVVADAALLALAFEVAAQLRGASDALPTEMLPAAVAFDPLRYNLAALTVIPGILVLFWLLRAYAPQYLLGGPEEYARVVSGCTYAVVLVVAASYLYGSLPLVSRGWLLLFWIFAIVLVCAGRFVLRRVAYALRGRGWFVQRALIVGANEQGLAIAEQLHGPTSQGIEVVGFLDDYLTAGDWVSAVHPGQRPDSAGRFRVFGHAREVQQVTALFHCDLLIVVPGALSWESQQYLAQLGAAPLDNLEVRLAPTHYDLTAGRVEPAPLGYIPLVRVQHARITGVEAVVLTALDCALALFLLVLLAPGLLWVVAAAKWRGIKPITVNHDVLGRGGQPVTIRLLNPRVSNRLLLRGLPALASVLCGQLALVGPRPVPVADRAKYQPWAGLLLAVKPGLTGPWRLADSAASPDEPLLTDIWWVRNWTIWQHLFVLFQTAQRMRRGSGIGESIRRWREETAPEPQSAGVLADARS